MKRWNAARKYKLLKDIESGKITPEQAKTEHALSEEELEEWKKRVEDRGINGLRAKA